MNEQQLLLLKEKIIKTDAVICLLAEKNSKYTQLQAKLQFVFEKFVEKSKEVKTLHRKVCMCIADHEPLKKRVVELESQYSDLETSHYKLLNGSELKFQNINKELETLKKKNEELLKVNEDLKNQIPLKTRKRNRKSSVREDEIDLLRTENELLSSQVDKLTMRCDTDSKELERLTLLLTETVPSNKSLTETSRLQQKISKLEIAEEQLREEVTILKEERNKLYLDKNLLKKSFEEKIVEFQLKLKNDKKSIEIEKLSLPLIETDAPDENVVEVGAHLKEIPHLKDKILKLEFTETQLRKEIQVLKEERNQLDDRLAELRLEKNLLEDLEGFQSKQVNHCEGYDTRLPLVDDDEPNKNVIPINMYHTDISQLKKQISYLEGTEEQLKNEIEVLKAERNTLRDQLSEIHLEKNIASMDLEKEAIGLHLEQVDLHEVEYVDNINEECDMSDAESVSILLKEMIDLPSTLSPFDDDSCSETEDCLGFPSTEAGNCKVCALVPPSKISERDNCNNKLHPLHCEATGGNFNIDEVSVEYSQSNTITTFKNQICTSINIDKTTKKYVESSITTQPKSVSEDECKVICKRKPLKGKPIVKKKYVKSSETAIMKRLKLAITRDMLRYINKYFHKNLKSIKDYNSKCSCKHKSAQFHANKKLIRQKVEKLRESKSVEDTSNSESESPPIKQKSKRTKSIANENSSEDCTHNARKKRISHNEKKPKSQIGAHKQQQKNTCIRTKSNYEKSLGYNLNMLMKDNVSSAIQEFEVISQDSGYARSEADSLELESQKSHEKISLKSPDLDDDFSELQPKKGCERKNSITNANIRRSCRILRKKENSTCRSNITKTENFSTSKKPINTSDSINSLPSYKLKAKSSKMGTGDFNLNIKSNNIFKENPKKCSGNTNHNGNVVSFIDSPQSPDSQISYDSIVLLSPLRDSPLEGVHIYNQVELNLRSPTETNMSSLVKFSSVDSQVGRQINSSETQKNVIPEESLRHLKDVCRSNKFNKTSTIRTSYKRPSCAKRLRQNPTISQEPVVATTPAPPKKMKLSFARKLFKELLSFGNVPTIVDQVASKFANQNREYVASLILSEVCLYTSEKIETKYTPPAPPLTQAQIILLGFMCKLENSSVTGLLETFMRTAEKAILEEINLEHLQQITRLYVGVCKFKKDLDRMRRMVCDAFYFMEDLAVPFLFTVLSSWIEILPLQIHSTDDLLVKVLIQVINLKTCKTAGYNLLPLRGLLKAHYQYSIERWNSDEVFQEVFIAYLNNPTITNEYAILILCKNHSTKWVLQQIDTHIKNLILNSESVYLKIKVLTMVKRIVKQFRPEETVERANLKTWLHVCLQGDLPIELREVMRKCIKIL